MNTGPTPVARVARVRRWWGERGVLASVVATTAPSLVLTFDDGPDPANTPRVLEVLRDRGASATFFVLMTRVRREPRLLAELMAAGHEVGLHGPDHRVLTQFSSREVRRRTEEARRELEDVTGTAVRWFRPPYGAQTPATWVGV
ncbi:MAG: polysaccharide deacetylase family protein, partial [Lapillicoccus sp.]